MPFAAAGTLYPNTFAMNAKSKIVLITAAACVAIGTPVYLQQREISSLREENAALRMKLSLEWRPQPGLANTRVRAVRVTGR